ncbi:hypothetical protein ACFCYB_20065 [Streptomyces sp. NPDC056309]|uniref:DUF7158 domain-containing protein n=1 Tax=unclassified Streptomyces TaxID=2593676 RepID=UPI0035E32444
MTAQRVAALVDGRALTEDAVEAGVAALRRGPLAARLPRAGTADARNLRRWVVQVMTYKAVLTNAAAALGLDTEPADHDSGLTFGDALRMGGVTAAVLASHPVAPAVRERVVADIVVSESAVRDYYDRNRDLYSCAYDEAHPAIENELRRAAADRRFTLWLERRHAESVTLMPGFEHPADPRHADATHRH